MKKYQVEFTYEHGGYYEIEASDEDEAYDIAEQKFFEEDKPSYIFKAGNGMEIFGVTPIEDAA